MVLYRFEKLNNQTVKDVQSLTGLEDSLDCLDGTNIFTIRLLASGTDRG